MDYRAPGRSADVGMAGAGPAGLDCGDGTGGWRDTASILGAMVSGRRAAGAVLQNLQP